MKLALYETTTLREPQPGLLTERGIVGIADLVPAGHTPQATMVNLIDGFDRLRPALEKRAREGAATSLADVRLRAPLPRPGKILACIANYWEHGALEARPLNMFLKSPDAVIGPGDTIVLPEFTEPWIFMHEAELALVLKGPAKLVTQENWRSAVFGYTGMIDVSARGEGRRTWKTGSWLGKLNSGDVIACGTNHEGLGPLQDGEVVDFEIHGVGRMRLQVRDPLKRTWEKGIYMGADSTHPEAVQRNRPPSAR